MFAVLSLYKAIYYIKEKKTSKQTNEQIDKKTNICT